MRASFSFGFAGLALAASVFLIHPFGYVLFPIAGLAASLLIHRGTSSVSQKVAAAVLATASFGFTGMVVAFSLISLQADIDPVWGAFAWGLGFGGAGFSTGWSFSPQARQGSLTLFAASFIAGAGFTLAGAIGGCLGFLLMPHLGVAALAAGIWLAFVLGGCACDAGWQSASRQSNTRVPQAGNRPGHGEN